MSQLNIKVVIPARYGSSRLPAKPLLEINEKPLFWHVVQRVLEAGILIDDILVATDDERILLKAKELDVPVVMTSTSHISGTDRINEVARLQNWTDDTLVVNVQGDEPLLPPDLVKGLTTFAVENNHFDIVTAVTPINSLDDFHNPNVVKAVVTEIEQALYFTRSPAPLNRDEPMDYSLALRHIGIYLYKVSVLSRVCEFPESLLEKSEKLEQLRALSNNLTIGVMRYLGDLPHGVDTQEDYLALKRLMK
ncbi:3-deoxy-manno-octulosonate cytidylyltransferase [Catenovulum sp. SX2]|uniref:3-deoxy-manno-octulosonate cytidylyltransferase n=1 Tax=Catenovulum sp. SX2 TaxID=3398614 RepID=UPI003F866071